MSDLRFFDELGVELERAARTGAGARRTVIRRPLGALAVVVALLLLAGVAVAAVLLTRQGTPLPAPPTGALGADVRPVAGSVHLAGLDAPDPGGGPPWDIRLSRSQTGETCTAVGQIVAGRFGIVGLDGVFRRLGLGGVDACGVPGIAGPVLAGARVFIGRTEAQARTVVNGVAGTGAQSVTVYGPGAARRLQLGPDGSFITVYAGYVEDVRPRIVVVQHDGRRYALALAHSDTLQTADPQGGPPWNVTGGADLTPRAYPDEQCTQVQRDSTPPEPGIAGQRQQPPIFEQPGTPQACGRLGIAPLFVAMQRFEAGDEQNGQWYWFDNPPRTVVYGAASPRVASLTLQTGSSGSRALTIDRSDGAFAAVLDAGQDPHSLTLIAHLKDGRVLTYKGSANLWSTAGKPISEPPTPQHGSPNQFSRRPPRPFGDPITSTIRRQLHATDPAGGPAWTLESWQAHPAPGLRFGNGRAPLGRFYCEQAGILAGGRLTQPNPGGKPQPLTIGDAFCNQAATAPFLFAQAYLSNPSAYAPIPLRVVLSGFVPPAATHALLLGDGAPRPLALDQNGGFLTVIPGRFWDTTMRVSARLPTGRTVTSSDHPQGTAAPQATAPDPDGGPPWGFRAGPTNFDMYGQVIENRLVAIAPGSSDGQFEPGPVEFGGGQGKLPRPNPLELFPQPLLDAGATTITAPEVQRRTLPGRTLIAGLAAPDVASVTISTPRDVRTLVPTGPDHAFIVVYDGYFYDSTVTATAVLKDGHTETQTVPYADYPSPGARRPRPTLKQELRLTERDLASLQQRHPQIPASFLRQAVASDMHLIAAIRAHLSYARTHPDALPPE